MLKVQLPADGSENSKRAVKHLIHLIKNLGACGGDRSACAALSMRHDRHGYTWHSVAIKVMHLANIPVTLAK